MRKYRKLNVLLPNEREGDIFYNPPYSYMANTYTGGDANINVWGMYGADAAPERDLLITEEDPLFEKLRALITLSGDKLGEEYFELPIKVGEYRELVEAWMAEEVSQDVTVEDGQTGSREARSVTTRE